jgi:hypothetical protein
MSGEKAKLGEDLLCNEARSTEFGDRRGRLAKSTLATGILSS